MSQTYETAHTKTISPKPSNYLYLSDENIVSQFIGVYKYITNQFQFPHES